MYTISRKQMLVTRPTVSGGDGTLHTTFEVSKSITWQYQKVVAPALYRYTSVISHAKTYHAVQVYKGLDP